MDVLFRFFCNRNVFLMGLLLSKMYLEYDQIPINIGIFLFAEMQSVNSVGGRFHCILSLGPLVCSDILNPSIIESFSIWRQVLKSSSLSLSLALFFIHHSTFPIISLFENTHGQACLFCCAGRLLGSCIVLAAWKNSASCKELSIYGVFLFRMDEKRSVIVAEWPNVVVYSELYFFFNKHFRLVLVLASCTYLHSKDTCNPDLIGLL